MYLGKCFAEAPEILLITQHFNLMAINKINNSTITKTV